MPSRRRPTACEPLQYKEDAWYLTDYPVLALGDIEHEPAPTRKVRIAVCLRSPWVVAETECGTQFEMKTWYLKETP